MKVSQLQKYPLSGSIGVGQFCSVYRSLPIKIKRNSWVSLHQRCLLLYVNMSLSKGNYSGAPRLLRSSAMMELRDEKERGSSERGCKLKKWLLQVTVLIGDGPFFQLAATEIV